jgi:hypothetical protein
MPRRLNPLSQASRKGVPNLGTAALSRDSRNEPEIAPCDASMNAKKASISALSPLSRNCPGQVGTTGTLGTVPTVHSLGSGTVGHQGNGGALGDRRHHPPQGQPRREAPAPGQEIDSPHPRGLSEGPGQRLSRSRVVSLPEWSVPTCKLTDEQRSRLRTAAIGRDTNAAVLWCARELRVKYSASGLYKLLPKLELQLSGNGRWQAA